MGSIDSALPLKREGLLLRPYSGRGDRHLNFQRPRSRFARFLIFKKLDYVQWICTVAVFFFFVVLFQLFLPGSVMDKSEAQVSDSGNLLILKEMGGLDFGEDIRFEPRKLLERFEREAGEVNLTSKSFRTLRRFGYRKPQLALVLADMLVHPQQIQMVTVAAALQEIGYAIQVYSLEDGLAQAVWKKMGVPVIIIKSSANQEVVVDWLIYDGIIINSIEARSVFSCFMQEPFKSLPIIWSIHEKTLATRLRHYNSTGKLDLINDWKRIFDRATVVVFPSYVLPMAYFPFDAGNFFVIPGSPAEALEAENIMSLREDNLRDSLGYAHDDFIIAIVGSQFLYRGLWLEHALVLRALLPLITDLSFGSNSISHYKIVILSGDSTTNYSLALEAIALSLGYPRGIVKHFSIDAVADKILSIVDVVIYGSFLEEPTFPENLLKAMCFGKLIVAPDLSMIKKYVNNRVNGYLFLKENLSSLTEVVLQVISNGKLSSMACDIASTGKGTAKNLKAWETIGGYAFLLENVLKLPSEVSFPKSAAEIDDKLKKEWQWHLFKEIVASNPNRTSRSSGFLDVVESEWNHTRAPDSSDLATTEDETFLYTIWAEEKYIGMVNAKKRREEEELKDRNDQSRGTWEDVYRNAKRIDRSKNDLHERDEREMERTGQPLCIYEPYFGEGAWPFLHRTSLYRGVGLSTKGRRQGVDDIDAPSRLPILGSHYYRDILGDYGAFFSIANRIDRVHKNAWIGFQSWRATARKASLSKIAEKALSDAIEARKHGDALYFWVRMDMDPRNSPQLDFWSFCDAINAGNCKFAFSEAFKKTYGIKRDWDPLPPMPMDGGTWSVMNSWVLPTRSFVEFVMFSRMFVDSLDARFYEEHRHSAYCFLNIFKDKHCYSRVLELLINVWAYHSARRMVHVDPETGAMQEQHHLHDRRGQMWVKWFSYTTLKNMDEDLAEEFDTDHPKNWWLWPLTGEIFSQGIYERERNQKQQEKEMRKQLRKNKISKMRKGSRQKVIGKYVKPTPDVTSNSNATR